MSGKLLSDRMKKANLTIKNGEEELTKLLDSLAGIQKWLQFINQMWVQDGWKLAKFFFCVFMNQDGFVIFMGLLSILDLHVMGNPEWPR